MIKQKKSESAKIILGSMRKKSRDLTGPATAFKTTAADLSDKGRTTNRG